MKLKSVLLAITLFVLSALAVAQNFTNNYFSATFVGTVTNSEKRNDTNTSTNYYFDARNTNVLQDVDIRLVDHNIPYGITSTDFYANNDFNLRAKTNPGATVSDRGTGTYQGHPFTYQVIRYSEGGYNYTERNRYIYIGAREVYFVTQTSLASYDDNAEWVALVSQMNIVR